MRTYLLRSYYPDEAYGIMGIASMKPRAFDFNPHMYTLWRA